MPYTCPFNLLNDGHDWQVVQNFDFDFFSDVVNLMLTHKKRESLWNCRICHMNFPGKKIAWIHVAKQHVINKLEN